MGNKANKSKEADQSEVISESSWVTHELCVSVQTFYRILAFSRHSYSPKYYLISSHNIQSKLMIRRYQHINSLWSFFPPHPLNPPPHPPPLLCSVNKATFTYTYDL